jgi:hypothetical protein
LILHGCALGVQTTVAVAVGVLVGVFVGVSVGVLVGVLVGVSVGVFVGVLVGVSVGVFVGVGVAVLKLRTTVGWDSVPPFVAVIVTGTSDPTLDAFTTIERQPLLAGITIDDGTGNTPGWLLLSATVAPPAAVAPFRQTVILP